MVTPSGSDSVPTLATSAAAKLPVIMDTHRAQGVCVRAAAQLDVELGGVKGLPIEAGGKSGLSGVVIWLLPPSW
jgi:hypothetical protein